MALFITWFASSLNFMCLSQLLSAEKVVLRSAKLTSVPQNITVNVTKLDLDHNKIRVLHNESFHLFKKIEQISLAWNGVWKIGNGTFDNNPLLVRFNCPGCDLKILPSSFGSAMDNINNLGFTAAFSNIGALISPYFDGFTSLERISMGFNRLTADDVNEISFPPSLQYLRLVVNRITQVPNVSSRRLPALTELHLHHNNLRNVSDSALAGMRNMKRLSLAQANLVALGDVSVLDNLETLWLYENSLETIPDMLGGVPKLRYLSIRDNSRMTCDRRMCWWRLWGRVRPPIQSDEVDCVYPTAARGHRLSLISPGFMNCGQGGWYCLKWKSFEGNVILDHFPTPMVDDDNGNTQYHSCSYDHILSFPRSGLKSRTKSRQKCQTFITYLCI